MSGGKIGVIGGSGLYTIEGLEHVTEVQVETPFGPPSDAYILGTLHGRELVFLPRHGRGHRIPPSAINFRANIDALKRAGATQVISVSAVGSLREHLAPGTFVIVDQFIDRTFARNKSFFGPGLVAHVSMARPVCARLGDAIEEAAAQAGIRHVRGGTYLVMEGPQFSTLAESELYRSWNCDVIGMTNMPEAKLAREAELCYATLALATDYDVWHETHAAVSVEAVVQNLLKNVATAREVLRAVIPTLAPPRTCACGHLLENAVITSPKAFPPKTRTRLALLLDRYFPATGRRRG